MKGYAAGLLMVAGCGVMLASGCAKHEMVKKDEGIAPATAQAAKPPVNTEAVKEKAVRKEVVTQSPVKESVLPPAKASQLQGALQKIYFDFDSYNLSDVARATLTKNAASMKQDSADKVRIEGNCDERGSDEYNLALGERRAKAALDYLVTMGIPADHLSYISYGKEKPADQGHNEADWTKNRRDDFVVVR